MRKHNLLVYSKLRLARIVLGVYDDLPSITHQLTNRTTDLLQEPFRLRIRDCAWRPAHSRCITAQGCHC